MVCIHETYHPNNSVIGVMGLPGPLREQSLKMWMYMYVCIQISTFTSGYIYLSAIDLFLICYPSIYLPICLSTFPWTHPSIPYPYLPTYLHPLGSISLSIHPSISYLCLSIHPSIHPPNPHLIHPSISHLSNIYIYALLACLLGCGMLSVCYCSITSF